MKHKDVASREDIPRPTYKVTYRGDVFHIEVKARDALARLPKLADTRGWRILLFFGERFERVIYDGTEAWEAARRAPVAA